MGRALLNETISCSPSNAYSETSCFQSPSLHHSVVTLATVCMNGICRNKRSKPMTESVSMKASKSRKCHLSLGIQKICRTVGGSDNVLHDKKEGGVTTTGSPRLTNHSKTCLQLCMAQRPIASSTLKKLSKKSKRQGVNDKSHQTTLILHPVKAVWATSDQVKGVSQCLDPSRVSGVPNDAVKPKVTISPDCTNEKIQATCSMSDPPVDPHPLDSSNIFTMKQYNETLPCCSKNNSMVVSSDESVTTSMTLSLCCEKNHVLSSKFKGSVASCKRLANRKGCQVFPVYEGIPRRQSLKKHFVEGRKRYDRQLVASVVKKTTGYDVATLQKKKLTTVQAQNVSHLLKQSPQTPGSATKTTRTFITSSTCASSGGQGYENCLVHYIYARDRTPVMVSQELEKVPQEGCKTHLSGKSMLMNSSYIYNAWIVLPSDRLLLEEKKITSCVRLDAATYGHSWFVHHKQNETRFQPWQMTTEGKIEKLRLGVIAMYWNSAAIYPISPATIYVAINNFGRLLHQWSKLELQQPTASRWALAAVTAFRLAFKAEERPEVMSEIHNIWSLFPMFQEWDIDRSTQTLNKMESEALEVLQDALDVPLGPMFLSLYINAAGWPQEVAKDYHQLGLYLLALTSFASTKDTFLKNVVPSRTAAAALILAIKIINGDRACARGMLHHLDGCPYPSYLAEKTKEAGVSAASIHCKCRYEFYPERLRMYTGFPFETLVPVIKGLSGLLRSKPPETCILTNFFPLWANNDWQ